MSSDKTQSAKRAAPKAQKDVDPGGIVVQYGGDLVTCQMVGNNVSFSYATRMSPEQRVISARLALSPQAAFETYKALAAVVETYKQIGVLKRPN